MVLHEKQTPQLSSCFPGIQILEKEKYIRITDVDLTRLTKKISHENDNRNLRDTIGHISAMLKGGTITHIQESTNSEGGKYIQEQEVGLEEVDYHQLLTEFQVALQVLKEGSQNEQELLTEEAQAINQLDNSLRMVLISVKAQIDKQEKNDLITKWRQNVPRFDKLLICNIQEMMHSLITKRIRGEVDEIPISVKNVIKAEIKNSVQKLVMKTLSDANYGQVAKQVLDYLLTILPPKREKVRQTDGNEEVCIAVNSKYDPEKVIGVLALQIKILRLKNNARKKVLTILKVRE